MAVLLRQRPEPLATVLLLVSAGLWTFLSARAFILFRRVRSFMEHLLVNDFETGIRTGGLLRDEIHSLGRLVDRVASQLRTYDAIYGDLVRLLNRQIEAILKNTETPVLVADLHGMVFTANPAMQRLFDVSQESFSFDSIRKQEGNERFFSAFVRSAVRDGIPVEGTATLQLPVRESRRTVSFRITPIRDGREKTQVAVIVISPAP